MHRLPILTPVKLPGRRWGDWIKVCFYVSDEVIIQRWEVGGRAETRTSGLLFR